MKVKGTDGRYHEMYDGDVLNVADDCARDRMNRYAACFEIVDKAVTKCPDNRMVNPILENR